jgi:hypothetical protein
MNSKECLALSLMVGSVVILLLQMVKSHPRFRSRLHTGIYAVCAVVLLLYIREILNGFLDSVNRLLVLCNTEFSTEMQTFTINGKIQPGADLFWVLLTVPAAIGILTVMNEKRVGVETLLVLLSLLVGFVLCRYASMWMALFCLLAGFLGTLVYAAVSGRPLPLRRCLYCVLLLAVVGGFVMAAPDYEGSDMFNIWKKDMISWVVRSRYEEEVLASNNLHNTADIRTLLYPTAGVVFLVYLLLVTYLVLELQRGLRIYYRKKWGYAEDMDEYVERMQLILRLAGVKGRYRHPLELTEQVTEAFPGISPGEYEQAVELIRKVRFEQEQLHSTEKYFLECFLKKMEKILYEKRRFLRKSWLRYRYVLNW